MYLPSLTALRAFHSAARLGSLTAAARELAVTTSAVSRQIKNLEESTGVPLVVRQGRGIRLTEDGRTLLRDLSDAFDRIDEAVDRIRRPASGERLRVASPPNFASAWLVPRLDRFRARSPEIEVILIDSSDKVGIAARDRLVIEWGVFEDDATTVAARLGDGEEIFPVCGPHVCPGPGLAGATLLECDKEQDRWRWPDWQTFLAATGLDDLERGESYVMHPRLLYEAARQGKGVMLTNMTVARDNLASGRFVRPVDETMRIDESYWVLMHRSQLGLPHVAAFVDWLKDEHASASRGNF